MEKWMFKVEALNKYEDLPLPTTKKQLFFMDVLFRGKLHRRNKTRLSRWHRRHLKPQRTAITWIDFIFSCYTAHVFEGSLDDILSLPLMYKCNSTQRSIFLLSLPLHPLCFILAITLRKSITSDHLRSVLIFSPCPPSYSWPCRWASAWPNKTNKLGSDPLAYSCLFGFYRLK